MRNSAKTLADVTDAELYLEWVGSPLPAGKVLTAEERLQLAMNINLKKDAEARDYHT